MRIQLVRLLRRDNGEKSELIVSLLLFVDKRYPKGCQLECQQVANKNVEEMH